MSWPLLAAFGKLLQKKRELNKQKQKGTEGRFSVLGEPAARGPETVGDQAEEKTSGRLKTS